MVAVRGSKNPEGPAPVSSSMALAVGDGVCSEVVGAYIRFARDPGRG
ncbi:hypothetical protein ACIBEK_23490 [Nocardia fusca]